VEKTEKGDGLILHPISTKKQTLASHGEGLFFCCFWLDKNPGFAVLCGSGRAGIWKMVGVGHVFISVLCGEMAFPVETIIGLDSSFCTRISFV